MGTQRFRYAIAADVVADSDWAIYRAELRALYRLRVKRPPRADLARELS